MPVTLAVANNNWFKDFPYSPEMTVTLRHDDDTLYITYNVKENHIAAKADKDNGEVWKDSCGEFFIAFDDKGYYNIESNCAGKILMSHRTGRKENVEYAPSEVLATIKRDPSLGSAAFECRKAEAPWSLTLAIPVSAFFKHNLKSFNGIEARCNIYKCGDELPDPHFLSLFPIDTPKPDFHRPEFFGDVRFD